VTIQLPAGWLADQNVEGMHELRLRLRPPAGASYLDVVLSGAAYGRDPVDSARGLRSCVNGIPGRLDERPDGTSYMELSLGRGALNRLAESV
jgi:hypothetical protein